MPTDRQTESRKKGCGKVGRGSISIQGCWLSRAIKGRETRLTSPAFGASIYDVHTDGGGGSINAAHLRTNGRFCGQGGEGSQQIPKFCGRHMWKPLKIIAASQRCRSSFIDFGLSSYSSRARHRAGRVPAAVAAGLARRFPLQGSPTGFYTGNWSIRYNVWEMSY